MIAHRLSLDYAIGTGWLTPYIDALRMGNALAMRCASCYRASFPPVRICPCGCADGDWAPLTGEATIEWRTGGTDGAFALVTFDGAETRSVVRLDAVDPTARRGRLRPPPTVLPQLVLGPLEADSHGD